MNINIYNWDYEDAFEYKRGDNIELTTNRLKDNGWDVGTILTISNVYNDGDIYAIDMYSYGRILKPGEFKLKEFHMGDIDNVSIKILSNIIPGMIRSHFVRCKKDKEIMLEKSNQYYKSSYTGINNRFADGNNCSISYYTISNGDLSVYPRMFYTLDSFYSFCKDNNIVLTSCDKDKLKSFYYINCYYDDKSQCLVYASSYYRLKELVSIFVDKDDNNVTNKDCDFDDESFMIFNAKDSDYKLISVKYNEDKSALTSFMFEDKEYSKPYLFKTRDEAYDCKKLISERCNGCIDMVVIRAKDYIAHTS